MISLTDLQAKSDTIKGELKQAHADDAALHADTTTDVGKLSDKLAKVNATAELLEARLASVNEAIRTVLQADTEAQLVPLDATAAQLGDEITAEGKSVEAQLDAWWNDGHLTAFLRRPGEVLPPSCQLRHRWTVGEQTLVDKRTELGRARDALVKQLDALKGSAK